MKYHNSYKPDSRDSWIDDKLDFCRVSAPSNGVVDSNKICLSAIDMTSSLSSSCIKVAYFHWVYCIVIWRIYRLFAHTKTRKVDSSSIHLLFFPDCRLESITFLIADKKAQVLKAWYGWGSASNQNRFVYSRIELIDPATGHNLRTPDLTWIPAFYRKCQHSVDYCNRVKAELA